MTVGLPVYRMLIDRDYQLPVAAGRRDTTLQRVHFTSAALRHHNQHAVSCTPVLYVNDNIRTCRSYVIDTHQVTLLGLTYN